MWESIAWEDYESRKYTIDWQSIASIAIGNLDDYMGMMPTKK